MRFPQPNAVSTHITGLVPQEIGPEVKVTLEALSIRVNGLNVDNIHVQLSIVDGFPRGAEELVMIDPVIGPLVLTEDFIVETKQGDQAWMTSSVGALKEILNMARPDTEE
jgi:hypothetical protein